MRTVECDHARASRRARKGEPPCLQGGSFRLTIVSKLAGEAADLDPGPRTGRRESCLQPLLLERCLETACRCESFGVCVMKPRRPWILPDKRGERVDRISADGCVSGGLNERIPGGIDFRG